MDPFPTWNLLGALALGVADDLAAEAAGTARHGGEAAGALVTLGADPGLSVGALAQILRLTHSGAVRLVDRLVADGLVVRRAAPAGADRRGVTLALTPLGAERRRELLTRREARLRTLVEALSPTERQQLDTIARTLLARRTTGQSQGLATCRLCDAGSCVRAGCPVEQAYRAPSSQPG